MIRKWFLYPALAGLVVALLFFGLMFTKEAGVEVTQEEAETTVDRVTIVIVPTGADTVDIDGASVTVAALPETVEALLEEHRGTPVSFVIAAEQNTDTMLVVALMDQLQRGGALDVTIGGGQ